MGTIFEIGMKVVSNFDHTGALEMHSMDEDTLSRHDGPMKGDICVISGIVGDGKFLYVEGFQDFYPRSSFTPLVQ